MRYRFPLLCCCAVSTACTSQMQKPNILLIVADDYGWNDVGCMGSEYYETPNIDAIAAEGVMFTNGYAACQVSSPSRASIMTGKYTPRHGVTDWIGELSGEEWRTMGRHSKLLPADYKWELCKEELTLPEKLKENGYTTFIAGKWHLGENEDSWPEAHGFDINIGGWASGSPKGGYFSPYSNPRLEDGEPGENLSMRLANETSSFIEAQAAEGEPFFAYLSFYAVHGPVQTTQEKWSYFRDKAEKMGIAESGFMVDRTLPVRQVQDNPVYAGLVQQMDDAIGVVLKALKDAGIEDNTLVIFTSDNGGVTSGDNYSTSLLPLRGGKGRQWEGGLRVPFIVKGPGVREKGVTNDTPVIGTDIYPTILDFAGIDLVPEQHMDGVSIMPLLKGEKIQDRELYWHYPHYGNQGGEPSSVIRDGDWKLIYYYEDSRYELYNLARDLGETTPLNATYPEKVEELAAKLDKWLEEVGARIPEPDPLYDSIKEAEVKLKWSTETLQNREKIRKRELSPGWKPNDDWWGSQPTVD